MKVRILAAALRREVWADCNRYNPRCPQCPYTDPLALDNMAHCPMHGHWVYDGLSGRDRRYLALECERALNALPVQEIDNQRARAVLERVKAILAGREVGKVGWLLGLVGDGDAQPTTQP